MEQKNKHQKPHIGFFGRRNVGKSSLINLFTGQNIAIVSDMPGTTTDPVKKSVEILGVGASVVIDTAGIDDVGKLGELRIRKSLSIVPQIDLAVLVIAGNVFGAYEKSLISLFKEYKVPFFILHNKSDVLSLTQELADTLKRMYECKILDFSVGKADDTQALTVLIKSVMPKTIFVKDSLLGDILNPKDIVLLVTPIDSEAPEGRMILPQVMVWRDVLDNDCICMSVKDSELGDFMKLGVIPNLVITDSQAFHYVAEVIPETIPLTSFSIVLAKQKGYFQEYLEGTTKIAQLKDRDKVLILESCTHQVSCEDIGRVKIPNWLTNFVGHKVEFEFVNGFSDIKYAPSDYALVIQCGGCVVKKNQLQNRLKPFVESGIPVTNYGLAIALVNGIFDRVVAPFYNKI